MISNNQRGQRRVGVDGHIRRAFLLALEVIHVLAFVPNPQQLEAGQDFTAIDRDWISVNLHNIFSGAMAC